MAAMQPAALLRYDIRIVALSVVVAVALAYLALVIRARLKGFNDHRVLRTLLPATVMGLAIAGMHYVAMRSLDFLSHVGHPDFRFDLFLDKPGAGDRLCLGERGSCHSRRRLPESGAAN